MPETTRTFLAIPLPDDVVAALDRLRHTLEPDVPGAKWVDPRHYHITLAFLGDVANRDLESLGRAVTEAAAPFNPFDLRIAGLGAFPSPGKARTFWAGIGGPGVESLNQLQKAAARAAARAGYKADDADRFHPHVTLARIKTRPGRGKPSPTPDLSEIVRRHEGFELGPFRVAEVVVFASTLRPSGPEYDPITRAPLAGSGGA
jgi:2'-5' RNA ligase